MQLTPVGREAGALTPGAAGQGESKKEFRSKRVSGVAGGFYATPKLSFPCVPTACLAVYLVRVSTWAESGGEREEKQLVGAALEAVRDAVFELER